MSIDETPESAAFRSFKGAIEAEAEARGAGQALLRFLELRGVALSDEQRAHVVGCRDPQLVRRWVDRVFGATTTGAMLEAIFAAEPAPAASPPAAASPAASVAASPATDPAAGPPPAPAAELIADAGSLPAA
jgi:hypothetical protein